MIRVPPRVQQGKVASAAWLNQLRDAVEAVANINAGPGLFLTKGPTGMLLALASIGNDFKPAVIVAAPPGPDQPASSIRYDVRVVGSDRVETGLEARIFRMVSGQARLIPARVGDPCRVLSVANGDGTFTTYLCAMTEMLATATCDGDGPIP